jgi:tripartite-type tricarboxylate transporter receptor subunit TctC
MLTRRSALGLTAGLFGPATAFAQASPYPDRPVRYIVPFAPAGLTDIMARLVGQKLSDLWGKPVVVENRAGGNALIGADAAAKSPPDGYTLLAITLTHAVNVGLFPQAPYQLLRDFRAVSVLGSLPLVVVVPVASPVTSFAQLITEAKRRPLSGGSSGTGSPPHLGLELLRREAQKGGGPDANLIHASYRGGALALTDLVAGTLDFIVSNLPECIGHVRAGRLRALAITSAARNPRLPEVPTVRELGHPSMELTNWTAMMTNAAVPAPVFAEIERATLAAIRDPEVVRRAVEGGFEVEGWDAARSGAFVNEEVARWSRLVQEAGIKPE